MNNNRYRELMNNQDSKLTADEIAQGYHFCWEFDGLLVGPDMKGEWDVCQCWGKEKAKFLIPKSK